jgi:putative NADH-flavin reductase
MSTPGNALSIAVLGATGNIGAKVRDEAVRRGHRVTGLARDVSPLPDHPSLTGTAVDTHDREALAAALRGHDAAVVSVRWNSNDIDTVLDAVRDAGLPRVLVVVGAGSLRMADGRLYFDYNTERGVVAPTSEAALNAYRTLAGVSDLDWTAVSPAATIEPGERTGRFRLGGDTMITGEDGTSRISQEDFAVAIIDELERPAHRRARFTVGY